MVMMAVRIRESAKLWAAHVMSSCASEGAKLSTRPTQSCSPFPTTWEPRNAPIETLIPPVCACHSAIQDAPDSWIIAVDFLDYHYFDALQPFRAMRVGPRKHLAQLLYEEMLCGISEPLDHSSVGKVRTREHQNDRSRIVASASATCKGQLCEDSRRDVRSIQSRLPIRTL